MIKLEAADLAARLKEEVKAEIERGVRASLAAVRVGDDPASAVYVRNKIRACEEVGIRSEHHALPESTTTEQLLELISSLNTRDDVDGILTQLPLPAHVDETAIIEAMNPLKDVDGFHPVNAGRLQSGQPGLQPCTPAGIIEVLKRAKLPIAGQNAVVVGRSDIVGKPAALLLLNESATVTVCHSKTHDLAAVTRGADIIVAAIGRPGFIAAEMVKPGAVLIDVGINRLTDKADVERFFAGDEKRAETFAKRGSVIVGDIDPAAFKLASAYTPVPGGVGALTIAMLMHNTVKAAKLRRGITVEGE